MRGIPAASIVCLVAWAGCSFRGPSSGEPGDDAPQADAPQDDAPRMPACMTDLSYSDNGTHRYKVIQNVDYDTAIDRCAADDAHLAAAETEGESDYLRDLSGGNAWIGFDDLTVENVFRWVNGAATAFVGWVGAEPNDSNGEDCTYLRTDGTWNDTSCGEQRAAICECDPDYRPPATPACRMAASGFMTWMGRRYFVRTPTKTWQQAKADCESIDAHLVAISDLDENTNVDALLTGAQWLGYTDAAMEGLFRWTNSSPSTFNRWVSGTPTSDLQDCAVLQDSGAWLDVSCDDAYAYACECDPAPP
jgi:hypothetical protein